MCRSITRLREGAEIFPSAEIEAAALQFVRKISGFTKPSKSNEEAFALAVDEIAVVSEKLLHSLDLQRVRR